MSDAKGVNVAASQPAELREKCLPLTLSASFSYLRLIPLPHFLVELDHVEEV